MGSEMCIRDRLFTLRQTSASSALPNPPPSSLPHYMLPGWSVARNDPDIRDTASKPRVGATAPLPYPSASRLTAGCRGDQKKRSWSLGEAANTNTLAALSVSDNSGEGRRRHPSPTLTRFTQRCIHCRGYACLLGPVKAFFGSSLPNQSKNEETGVNRQGKRHVACT